MAFALEDFGKALQASIAAGNIANVQGQILPPVSPGSQSGGGGPLLNLALPPPLPSGVGAIQSTVAAADALRPAIPRLRQEIARTTPQQFLSSDMQVGALVGLDALTEEFRGDPTLFGSLVRNVSFGQLDRLIGPSRFAQELRQGDVNANRRRARASSTTLTGTRGLLTSPASQSKTLLGA